MLDCLLQKSWVDWWKWTNIPKYLYEKHLHGRKRKEVGNNSNDIDEYKCFGIVIYCVLAPSKLKNKKLVVLRNTEVILCNTADIVKVDCISAPHHARSDPTYPFPVYLFFILILPIAFILFLYKYRVVPISFPSVEYFPATWNKNNQEWPNLL